MLSQVKAELYSPLTGWSLSSSFLTTFLGLRLQSLARALCRSDRRRSNPSVQSLVASSLQTPKTPYCPPSWLSICRLPWWEEVLLHLAEAPAHSVLLCSLLGCLGRHRLFPNLLPHTWNGQVTHCLLRGDRQKPGGELWQNVCSPSEDSGVPRMPRAAAALLSQVKEPKSHDCLLPPQGPDFWAACAYDRATRCKVCTVGGAL